MAWRTRLSRYLTYCLTVLVLVSASVSSARAAANLAVLGTATMMYEPEAELKALPHKAHAPRRTQPAGQPPDLGGHRPAPAAIAGPDAAPPTAERHRHRPRAPPERP